MAEEEDVREGAQGDGPLPSCDPGATPGTRGGLSREVVEAVLGSAETVSRQGGTDDAATGGNAHAVAGGTAGPPAGETAEAAPGLFEEAAGGSAARATADSPRAGQSDEPSRSVLFGLVLFVLLLVLIGLALSTEMADSLVAFPRSDGVATSQRQQAQDAVDRSMALRARSQYDEAYALLIDFHNRHPDDALVNLELGRFYLEKSRPDYLAFAEQYFELAAEKLPANPKIAFFRGKLYLRRAQSIMVDANRSALRGQDRIREADRAEEDLRRASRYLDRASQGEVKYDLSQVSELQRQVRVARAENGIQAALALRDLARGPAATNVVTMRQAIDRAQGVLKLEDVLPSHHLRARELVAECEAEIRRRGR